MAENDVSVNGSSIGGKFTGRDDKSLNISTSYERSVYIQDLYEKYQREIASDPELKEICKELNYFTSQIEDDEMIGLEPKLSAASKNKEFIRYAKTVKEQFHMKLFYTSQYSQAAQYINVSILSKIERTFIMDIHTLICNAESEDKINILITERIIKPVMVELGLNLFHYTESDIMGMIFFLTGNCHIKWTA